MAVKKHELVHDNRNQVDLVALSQYIKLMNDQPNYLPPPNELIKHCQDIVKCLSRAVGNEEDLWDLLQSIEVFFLRIVSSVHRAVRHEIVTAILDKFYSLISDPQSDACPATSTVLVVLDGLDSEAVMSAARWLVQQGENGPAGAGLRASLSCLYHWMYRWQVTPALGHWVMAYIKALEENERYDILIEVSVDNIGNLFLALSNPGNLGQSVATVIFHILAALRESTDALDKITPHVSLVLTSLASDSGQWSRQLLQNVVQIMSAFLEGIQSGLTGEAADAFKAKHSEAISCLERHMASEGSDLLNCTPWRRRNVCLTTVNPHTQMRKVGLLNLGNTCYMNSVVQALLVTRQFSTHVVMNMNAVPYWAKMGVLFANMIHSVTNKLDPAEFLEVFKPPFFTYQHQHDSSEFLGYVLELLQSYEHCSDVNFDYSRPPVLRTNRLRYLPYVSSPGHSTDTESDSSPSRRSTSPRPGSSRAGSSSGGNKRALPGDQGPLKKRLRQHEAAFLRRDSFIDNMFGGVLLTRVECIECRSSSLSRDVFCDLQLAYPEKPEGWQYSVQSLLEFYCSKERLSGENRYYCRDCGGLRDAERSVIIEATPKYLVLVLKNFKFEAKLLVQTKLMHSTFHNQMVTLPTVRSQAGHSTYTLYAAVIHTGTTLDSGHYYTLAYDNGEWHTYNDEVVAPADEHHLISLNRASTPYILFYRRTDIDEGTAPQMEDMPPKLQEMVEAHNKHCVETVRQICVTRP